MTSVAPARHSHPYIFTSEFLTRVIGCLTGAEATVAARVCRQWLQPSLDVVWGVGIVELGVLVELLGSTNKPMIRPGDSWDFIANPDEASRRRFAFYAGLIRQAIVPTHEAGPRIIRELEYLTTLGPLTPKLEVLHATTTRNSSIAPYFVHQGLREIQYTNKILPFNYSVPDGDCLVTFINTFAQQACRLQGLYFSGTHPLDANQAVSLAKAVLALPHLETIQITQSEGLTGIIHTLAMHPNVKKIIVGGKVVNFDWNSYTYRNASIFPNLEKLAISLPAGPGTVAILRDIRKSRSLVELSLSGDINEVLYGLNRNPRQLYEGVGHHQDLRRLELDCVESWHFDFSVVEPILQCNLLEHLSVHTSHCIYINESQMRELAEALPLLRTLTLIPTESHLLRVRSGASTLLSIVHLLANCPKLSRIEILVDVRSQIPDVASVNQVNIAQRESLELIMTYSAIGEGKNEGIIDFMRKSTRSEPRKNQARPGRNNETIDGCDRTRLCDEVECCRMCA